MVGMDAQKPLAERPTAISNSIMRIRPEDLKAGLRDRYIIMHHADAHLMVDFLW